MSFLESDTDFPAAELLGIAFFRTHKKCTVVADVKSRRPYVALFADNSDFTSYDYRAFFIFINSFFIIKFKHLFKLFTYSAISMG